HKAAPSQGRTFTRPAPSQGRTFTRPAPSQGPCVQPSPARRICQSREFSGARHQRAPAFLPTLNLKRIDPRAQFAKQVIEARLGRVRLLDPEVDRPYQVADGKEVLAPPLRFALSSFALSSFALSSLALSSLALSSLALSSLALASHVS